MTNKVQVLHLDDSALDAELVREQLEADGLPCDVVRTDGKGRFEAALSQGAFDLILLDYNLPGYNAFAALGLAAERQPGVPLIILSGALGDEKAVECLKRGATDYVLKGHLGRLVPVARRALAEAEERRRRQAVEAQLRESEERFRAFMDHTDVVAWVKDRHFRFVYGNVAFERLFGRPMAEMLGRTDFDLLPAEHAAVTHAHDAQVLSHNQPLQTLELVPGADGRTRWWQVCKFPFRPAGDGLNGEALLGGMAVDVTARKESEEALGAALAEKVTLLREIHHRVKNNLQTISSLLSLQIRSLGQNAELIAPLRECQGRVRAMAMLHEKLYGDGGVERVDFGDYLDGLLQELLRSARPAGVELRLERDLQTGVRLPLDTAVPLGLIANELIANGLKHAFTGRPCGVMRVGLRARSDGLHQIVVSDDGRGLPAGFAIPLPRTPATSSRNGFGLRLVGLLAKQLGATITAGPNGAPTGRGAAFTVEWRQVGAIP